MLVLLLCCFSALSASTLAAADTCAPRINTVRPVPLAATGELSIATQNLRRLFDDVDDGRGEVVPGQRYQQRLDKLAQQIALVLQSPAVVAVQEVENIKVLEELAAAVTRVAQTAGGQDARYQSVLLEGHDRGGIDVGFLVRDDVTVLSAEQVLAMSRLGKAALFDRPPLLLRVQTAQGRVLDIVNVHLKSMRGSADPEVAKKILHKRQHQAQALAEWAEFQLAVNPQAMLIMLGDFNATPEVLGGVDVLGLLQEQGLHNTSERLPDGERYTFVYQCRLEALDHVLVSPALQASVQALAVSRGNAGASWRFVSQGDTPLRSSDHDALVLYLAP